MKPKVDRKARTAAQSDIPHSWDVPNWPSGVWPNSPARARWVLRSFRGELVAAGALSRSGKALIVLGRGYAKWLAARAAYVAEFESNNPAMRPPDAGSAAA